MCGSAIPIPFYKFGSEFMPPLNEGRSFTCLRPPGNVIEEAARFCKSGPDLKQIPKWETVFGKAGQAETSTDPAPLSHCFETV